MPNLQCRECGQVQSSLGTPPDRGIDGWPLCDACCADLYGASERHEPMNLFTPAPPVMPGQLGLSVD